MFSEMNKSISAALYERVTSPFYGALLITWFIWNWKIPYLTFFVNEEKLKTNKLDYIVENFYDINNLIIYPLISTVLVLTILPFITNGAFWLHIKFSKWRIDQKNTLEMKTLLTLEQSIRLREEVLKSEEKFENLLERKNQEIKELNFKISEMSNFATLNKTDPQLSDKTKILTVDSPSVKSIAQKIINSEELSSSFKEVVRYIQGGYAGLLKSENVTPNAVAYFEANNLIDNQGKGMYTLTDRGRDVLKYTLGAEY